MSLGPRLFSSLAALTILLAAIPVFGSSAEAAEGCVGGTLAPGRGEDLILSMSCRVTNRGTVILTRTNTTTATSTSSRAAVSPSMTRIEFWRSHLIENGGSLIAGLSRRRSATRAASRSCCTVMRNSPPAPARATAGKASSAGPRPTGIPGRAAFRSSPRWNSQGTRPVELPGTDEHGAPITDYFYLVRAASL